MIRVWVAALLIVLALAAGLAVDSFLFCPFRVQRAEDRARREFAHREGEVVGGSENSYVEVS